MNILTNQCARLEGSHRCRFEAKPGSVFCKHHQIAEPPKQQDLPLENEQTLFVPGANYSSMTIHPIVFAELNSLPNCAFNIIKFVCRHRSKDGKRDLEKAKHYCQLGMLMWGESSKKLVKNVSNESWGVSPEDFIRCNSIPPTEADIITTLMGIFNESIGVLAYVEAMKKIAQLAEHEYR